MNDNYFNDKYDSYFRSGNHLNYPSPPLPHEMGQDYYGDYISPEGVQLINDGSRTVVQLSIEQLQHVISQAQPNVVSPPVSTYDYQEPIKERVEEDNPKSTKPPKKQTGHHLIERRYRQNLNDKISALKDVVIGTCSKVSKGAILDEAVATIINLRNKVGLLTHRIRQLENSPGHSSTPPSEEAGEFVSSGLDLGRFALCFFVFVVFLINPFSYFVQSGADVAFAFSAFVGGGKGVSTRVLLAHAHGRWVWDEEVYFLAKSVGLWGLALLLNLFLFMVLMLNILTFTLLSVESEATVNSKWHLKRAYYVLRQGEVGECENNISHALGYLGISSSPSAICYFRCVLNLFYSVLVYFFGHAFFRRFYRFLALSSHDYGKLAEYMSQLSEVYVLEGLLILKRGGRSPDEIRTLLNSIFSSTLSGDVSLLVQSCSLVGIALRSLIPSLFQFIPNRLIHRAVSTAHSEEDVLLAKLAGEIDPHHLRQAAYSSVHDFKSLIFLCYVDSVLIECITANSMDKQTGAELQNVLHHLDQLAYASQDDINYRRSIVGLLSYVTAVSQKRLASISGIYPLHNLNDPLMACANQILSLDSQIHRSSLSGISDLLHLCKTTNDSLSSCGGSEEGNRLARYFRVFLWVWMLTIRQESLIFVSAYSVETLPLFEDDFKAILAEAHQLDFKLFQELSDFSLFWSRI